MKKPATKKRLAEVREKIEIQRRRAARPSAGINAHAPVTKSLEEKKASVDRKARQQRWRDEH